MGESDWRPTPSSSVAGSSIYKKEGILTRLGVSPIKDNFKSHHLDFASSSASSCYQSHYSVPMKNKFSKAVEADAVMSPSTSSSSNSSTMNAIIGGPNGTGVNCDFSTSNSSSSSGLDFKRSDYKRFTLPSIMTTSKFYFRSIWIEISLKSPGNNFRWKYCWLLIVIALILTENNIFDT